MTKWAWAFAPGPLAGAGEKVCTISPGRYRTQERMSASRGWIEEPNDVIDLFHEQRIVGQFEPVGSVWFELERPPDPADRGGRQTRLLGHRGAGPMGRFFRGGFQRVDHYFSTWSAVTDGTRPRGPPTPARTSAGAVELFPFLRRQLQQRFGRPVRGLQQFSYCSNVSTARHTSRTRRSRQAQADVKAVNRRRNRRL